MFSVLFDVYRSVERYDEQDGRLSAYSMFNKNFETLPGNFDANAVERNVRHNHDNMT